METDCRDEYMHLLGTAPLQEFLDFVRMRVDKEDIDEGRLALEWRQAAEYARGLESAETASPDGVVQSLPEGIASLAEATLHEPCVERTFQLHTGKWESVELDHLVLHQRAVNLRLVDSIKAQFGNRPTDEEIFRICAGRSRPIPDVLVTRQSDSVYSFTSASTDLRLLDISVLEREAVLGLTTPGRVSKIVGISVGFGINFISAYHTHNRLILTNGTHRAYALRDVGVTHIPCFVRQVLRDDDLDMKIAADIKHTFQQSAKMRRPPMLKDFFDPRLRKVISATRTGQTLHVQINAQRMKVPFL